MRLKLPKSRQIKMRNRLFNLVVLVLFLFTVVGSYFISPTKVYASATGYLMLDRMKANTTTGGSVCFNPNANQTTVRQMAISFADGSGTGGAASFAVNSTGSNWTWDTTNIPPGTTAFPGTATTSTVSTGTVTFIVTADQSLNNGTTYCLHFTGTSTLTTPTSAGNNFTGTITLKNNGGSQIGSETINYATSIVSDDQIAVTATVPATFSFSLGSNTAALGTLSTSSVTSATGITATISTNARLGWSAWVKGSTNGLFSTIAATAIPAAGAYGSTYDLSSTTGYGLDVNSGSGSPTIDTAYNGSGDANFVGTLATSFKSIATKATPGSSDTVTLRFRSKISATQQAATDYADTVTVVAAGNF